MSEREDELRWRLELLRAQFEQGKFFISEHLAKDVEKSLMAVKYGSDGKIDLTTVDARVRAMSLAAAMMENREREKNSASLEEISNLYFRFIRDNLGEFVKAAKEKKLDANQFAHLVSRHKASVDEISPQIGGFVDTLEEFWQTSADASHYHIQDL